MEVGERDCSIWHVGKLRHRELGSKIKLLVLSSHRRLVQAHRLRALHGGGGAEVAAFWVRWTFSRRFRGLVSCNKEICLAPRPLELLLCADV